MTLTVLASVSLFALVSTARPLRRVEEESLAYHQPSLYNEAVRTVLESGAEDTTSIKECLECHDEVQIHLSSVEEVQDYLSVVDAESVKALVHLEEQSFHSSDEKELLDVLQRMDVAKGRHTPVSDEQIENIIAMSMDLTPSEQPPQNLDEEPSSLTAQGEAYLNLGYSTPVIVITASCIASLLALACIGVALYVVEILKRNVLTSHLAWDMLPNLEKKAGNEGGQSDLQAERHMLLVDVTDSDAVPVSEKAIDWDRGLLSPCPLHKSISQTSLGTDKSDQEFDEKFYDVASSGTSSPYSTPSLPTSQLPSEEIEKSTEGQQTAHKPLPLLAGPEMQEVENFPGSFTTRPTWSVRATEAKLRKVQSDDDHPRSGVSAERRPYGAAPHFDAALAMQLRPGFGIGADAAWLVRFVMAVFGWCAVLVSGRRD